MASTRRLVAQLLAATLLVGLLTPGEAGNLDHLLALKPKASLATQTDTVRGLLLRLLPKQAHLFEVIIDVHLTEKHLDKFKIEGTANQTIRVTGNTGVAAANGLYYYLKNVANCSTSWSGDQLYNLPVEGLPLPRQTIEVVIQDKLRYYQNVCTVSYSMVWWDWTRWEREIDWMALRAINLPLAFNGQETVFRKVFMGHFNLSQAQVDNYLSGPAFLAWNRMGNMQTWSGPLSDHWHDQQEALQKRILARMRAFGMYSVVPAFAGHVPRDLATVLPRAQIDRLPDWVNLGENYSSTYFLQPEDPAFTQINKLFIQEYIQLYGTDHFYNIDLFNEETPTHSDPAYLTKCGKGVYESVLAADPNGIWLMQGWLFVNQPDFWKKPQVKAMIQSVPLGRLLILDLFSEVRPIYGNFDGYYGQPFIWCMLHNFGGTSGMYGALNRINEALYGARKQYSNLLGIGLTPEGIEQNPVAYEYMMDSVWYATAPNMSQWFTDYTVRRYGRYDVRLDKAWQLLRVSVYTDTLGVSNHGQYALNLRPRLDLRSTLWYQPANLTDALQLMADYLHSHPAIVQQSATFVYDMVDVSRQALQLVFDHYLAQSLYPQVASASLADLKVTSRRMLSLFDLLESILQCDEHFLLYRWVSTARALGRDAQEKDNYEWQARNQVTIWGPKGNILDYANKHWSGLMAGYYKPRWELFLKQIIRSVEAKRQFNQTQFNHDVFHQVELPFTHLKGFHLVEKAQSQNLAKLVAQVLDVVNATINHPDHQNAAIFFVNARETYN